MSAPLLHSTYAAYGLSIWSAVPLPELPEASRALDVAIRIEPVDRPPQRAWPVQKRVTRNNAEFSWPEAGRFRVRAGREIRVRPELRADPALVRLYLLGPALATLLRQRGFLVLHASAAEVGVVAVAFLGASGSGKSTLVAALVARGHRLVSDDYLPVDVCPGGVTVPPGVPQLKLWRDAASILGSAAHPLYSGAEKYAVPLRHTVAMASHELRRVYVLTQGDSPEIQRLTPQGAMVELLRHSYGPRTLAGIRTAEHFRDCARVVDAVPIARLCVPRSLTALPDVCRLIEERA